MKNQYQLLFCKLGIIFTLAIAAVNAKASCDSAERNDFSRGDYRIESIETAQVSCEPKNKSDPNVQSGPGCFVELHKIDPNEKLLSKDIDIHLYAVSEICSKKKGSVVKENLTSWCCDDETYGEQPCGLITKKTKVCFTTKTYYETGDITGALRNLDEVDKVLERLHKQSK